MISKSNNSIKSIQIQSKENTKLSDLYRLVVLLTNKNKNIELDHESQEIENFIESLLTNPPDVNQFPKLIRNFCEDMLSSHHSWSLPSSNPFASFSSSASCFPISASDILPPASSSSNSNVYNPNSPASSSLSGASQSDLDSQLFDKNLYSYILARLYSLFVFFSLPLASLSVLHFPSSLSSFHLLFILPP